jgi:hypothetical protein
MRIDQIELSGSLAISASLATNPLVINDDYLFVSNAGNVGIGTKTPTSKLVVTGSVSVQGSMVATSLVGSLTGSVKLPTIAQGTSETNIVLVNGGGNLVYRDNLSLTGAQGSQGTNGTIGLDGAQGAQGATGANAGITTYTNPADNRVITSVSSTEINAESNLTFDGSILDVNTTAAIKLPVGTTAERPASPSNGMIRYNSTNGNPEWYDSFANVWVNFGSKGFVSLEYIIIGGAGGGGRGFFGGGGGAGGYRSFSDQTIEKGISTIVTIGAGGGANGGSGASTTFLTNISSGGGGGSQSGNGGNGASGGGSGGYTSAGVGGSGNIPATTPSQGNNGGNGASSGYGGGGGGAQSAASGQSAGSGISSSITGTAITRAIGGTGGSGGPSVHGTPGGANTGNGGNGAGGNAGPPNGGAGGSGVVIIKWLSSRATINLTSGAETNAVFYTDGSFSIAEIKSSGIITFN